jgi:hypothetical protein
MADTSKQIGQGAQIAMEAIYRALLGDAAVNAKSGKAVSAKDIGNTALTVGLNSLPFGAGGGAAAASPKALALASLLKSMAAKQPKMFYGTAQDFKPGQVLGRAGEPFQASPDELYSRNWAQNAAAVEKAPEGFVYQMAPLSAKQAKETRGFYNQHPDAPDFFIEAPKMRVVKKLGKYPAKRFGE